MNRNRKRTLLANCKRPFFVCFALAVLGTPGRVCAQFTEAHHYDNTPVHVQGLEGRISYSFTNSLWASLDTRYCFRGSTSVDGVNQNDAQQNFILGSECSP